MPPHPQGGIFDEGDVGSRMSANIVRLIANCLLMSGDAFALCDATRVPKSKFPANLRYLFVFLSGLEGHCLESSGAAQEIFPTRFDDCRFTIDD